MKAKGRREEPITATTPEEAFLQAIHANITDPGPWEMYADWLEERGDPNGVLYRERRATDAFGITFVTVPAGTFWMGGGGGKPGELQRTVQVFQIGMHPVTQGQWEAVMGSNPSCFSRGFGGRIEVEEVADDDLSAFPVETVSWDDAQQFIEKLNEDDRAGGWLYRLPTEAEWEYACRGGATSKEDCSFHFYAGEPSNILSSTQANFNGSFPDGNAAKGPFLGRTVQVASYPSNPLEIFDMHGNVWEWCEDSWVEGWAPSWVNRVIRGGSWNYNGNDCRAAYRSGDEPALRYSNVGFRLARVPSRSKESKGLGPPGAQAGGL